MTLLLVVLLADLAAAAPPAPPVRNQLPEGVTIQVTQSEGFGANSRIDIRRTPRGFSDGTRTIDEPLLRALVASATAAPVPTVDALRLRVDPAALRRAGAGSRSPACSQRYRMVGGAEPKQLPPKARARLVERLCDPKNLSQLLAKLAAGEWDELPSIEVDLTLRDGEHVLLHSGKQVPLMLPWQIVRGNRRVPSFDPEISRAVVALLPAFGLGGAANQDGIAGFTLVDELVCNANALWGADLQREADAETDKETYGAQLAQLRRRFQFSDDSLRYGLFGRPESWNGTVRAANEPRVQFDLTLSIRAEHVVSLEPFLRDADGLSRRVRAVPWIARFLAAHPTATITITYHDDRSISAAAEEGRLPSPSPSCSRPSITPLPSGWTRATKPHRGFFWPTIGPCAKARTFRQDVPACSSIATAYRRPSNARAWCAATPTGFEPVSLP